MANLYYAKELRKIFDDKISGLALAIADDETLTNDRIVNGLKEIRCFRKFADLVIADLEEVDRAEEAAKRQKEIELEETSKAAKEAYDNLFDKKTWLKKAEEAGNGTDT